jgi:hypothetical protein
MGIYINPAGETKESWLRVNAREVMRDQVAAHDFGTDSLPLVLIVAARFTVLLVLDNPYELQEFLGIEDPRRKTYFQASREAIAKAVHPELARYVLLERKVADEG